MKIADNIHNAVVGKDEIIKLILTCFIAEGNVLLEDAPGTGKTLIAKSLAKSVNGRFSRIQFTPDMLPSDITGINFYNRKEEVFELKKGPVFCNVLLADEINRATPRTQSALLECMEEKQVTIDTKTLSLESPFLVIATQNPVENYGTFPLPEAQLDRFMMKLSVGYPETEEEKEILKLSGNNVKAEELEPVATVDEVNQMIKAAQKIYIHDDLIEYIAKIADATRKAGGISLGISPRGSIALMKAAKAYAYLNERSYVIPEDIKYLAPFVLNHRMISASGNGIEEIMNKIEVPTEEWSN